MIPAEFGITPQMRRQWGIVALVGLVAALVIGLFQPASLFGGYLAAFVLVSGVPLGAVSIAFMFQLTGGRWGRGLNESLRFAAGALIVAPLLAIPIFLGLPWLYPWFSDPPAAGTFRALYLNTPAFVARGAVYLLVWVVLGVAVARTGDPDEKRTRKWVGPVLVFYLLTLTFAAVDWIGSMDRHWYSTVLGFYVMTGQALSALALFALLAPRRPETPDTQTLHDWGNLLLTFVVLFAYMAYSQFFIIWNGNLPHEIAFYVPRVRGAWGVVALILIIIEFALPFFALLARNAKRNPIALAAVAAVVIAARVVDSPWMVLPALPTGQLLGIVAYILLVPALTWFWLVAAGWVQGRLLPAARWQEARP
jgi:hypothetical protein